MKSQKSNFQARTILQVPVFPLTINENASDLILPRVPRDGSQFNKPKVMSVKIPKEPGIYFTALDTPALIVNVPNKIIRETGLGERITPLDNISALRRLYGHANQILSRSNYQKLYEQLEGLVSRHSKGRNPDNFVHATRSFERLVKFVQMSKFENPFLGCHIPLIIVSTDRPAGDFLMICEPKDPPLDSSITGINGFYSRKNLPTPTLINKIWFLSSAGWSPEEVCRKLSNPYIITKDLVNSVCRSMDTLGQAFTIELVKTKQPQKRSA